MPAHSGCGSKPAGLGPLLHFPATLSSLVCFVQRTVLYTAILTFRCKEMKEALLPSWCGQGNSNTRELMICVMRQVLQSTAQVWLVPDKPGRAWGRRTGQGRSLRQYPQKRGPVWSCRPLWTEMVPHRVWTRGKTCALRALPSHWLRVPQGHRPAPMAWAHRHRSPGAGEVLQEQERTKASSTGTRVGPGAGWAPSVPAARSWLEDLIQP